jgi:hypothetical protein
LAKFLQWVTELVLPPLPVAASAQVQLAVVDSLLELVAVTWEAASAAAIEPESAAPELAVEPEPAAVKSELQPRQ